MKNPLKLCDPKNIYAAKRLIVESERHSKELWKSGRSGAARYFSDLADRKRREILREHGIYID